MFLSNTSELLASLTLTRLRLMTRWIFHLSKRKRKKPKTAFLPVHLTLPLHVFCFSKTVISA